MDELDLKIERLDHLGIVASTIKDLKIVETIDSRIKTSKQEIITTGEAVAAMIINGLATASILSSEPDTITNLIEKGALGASVSGNGPAIAAITKKENESNIKKVFASLEGRVIVSKISNKKAEVHEV